MPRSRATAPASHEHAGLDRVPRPEATDAGRHPPEFVGLLNDFGTALDGGGDALPAYQELLAHTEAHFAMEEDWMARCGFEPQN